MDKTVKLWDITTSTCLKTFSHTDYGEFGHRILLSICCGLLFFHQSKGAFPFVPQFYLFGLMTSILHFLGKQTNIIIDFASLQSTFLQ